jgi:hypothetical protein
MQVTDRNNGHTSTLEPEEWGDAVRLARERDDAASLSTADWLLGIPNLADSCNGWNSLPCFRRYASAFACEIPA